MHLSPLKIFNGELRKGWAVGNHSYGRGEAADKIHPGADDSDRTRAYRDRRPPSSCGWRSRRSSMHPLKLAIGCAWLVFWIYWIASASSSKESVRSGWRTRLTGVSAVGVFVIAGVLRGGSLVVHSSRSACR